MLSSVPVGSRFSNRRDLRKRLALAFRGSEEPIIRDYFYVKRHHPISSEVNWLLSCDLDYGALIGLRIWGPSFTYIVTKETHNVAAEAEGMGLISKREAAYLRGLGKKVMQEEAAA